MINATSAAMVAWIEKKFHASALRFLGERQASNAIEGLKAMRAR